MKGNFDRMVVDKPTREPQPSSGWISKMIAAAVYALGVGSEIGSTASLLRLRSSATSAIVDRSLPYGELAPALLNLMITSLGALVVLRSESRRFGWLLLGAGTAFAVNRFAMQYSLFGLIATPQAELPMVGIAAWVQDLWPIPVMLVFSLPFLFPDGQLPGPRWRIIFWPLTAAWSLFALVFAFAERPLSNAFIGIDSAPLNPFGFLPWDSTAGNVIFAILLAASTAAAIASAVHRWQGAGSEMRQQIKWVLYAFIVLLTLQIAAVFLGSAMQEWAGIDLGLDAIFDAAIYAAQLSLVLSLGIAIFKYRLFDVDSFINRTLVYGGLTAIALAVYVAFVAGVGALLPPANSLFLSLLATAVIAVVFDPLRVRLQRGVNRLMYGDRDEPYHLLSRLGEQLQSTPTPEAMLRKITKTVSVALKLPHVAIHLRQGGDTVIAAEYGSAGGWKLALELVHQNETIGQLVVAPRAPGESFSTKDRQLLSDIAHQAGAVAHSVRLTADLKRSRQELVTAREEERRRLRRDLHDGLGPTLASQTMKLDSAIDLVREDPLAAVEQLEELHRQTQEVVAGIRQLVHELRPPVLDDLGLVGAVEAHVQHSRRGDVRPLISVEGPPNGLPELPAAVEVAAYRIILEAITNALRHSQAENCQIRYSVTDGTRNRALEIRIKDDGCGVPGQFHSGVGIPSMRERAEELGGTFSLGVADGGGTLVRANLPLPDRGTP